MAFITMNTRPLHLLRRTAPLVLFGFLLLIFRYQHDAFIPSLTPQEHGNDGSSDGSVAFSDQPGGNAETAETVQLNGPLSVDDKTKVSVSEGQQQEQAEAPVSETEESNSQPDGSMSAHTSSLSSASPASSSLPTPTSPTNLTRGLVIPHMKDRDIEWITRLLPNETIYLYTVDDPSAPLHPPINKGREANVYLTYIIDHYSSLPDVVLFFHEHQFAWHNNILLNMDSAKMIRRLRTEYVKEIGYFPARCHTDPGCPDWIHPDRPMEEYDDVKKPEERFFTSETWREIYPDVPVPHALSQPCCAQFGVSREIILSNPLSTYVDLRHWLTNTAMDDQYSGRIFEYLWQYIFLKKPEYCPSSTECYCKGYGVCFEDTKYGFEKWEELRKQRDEIAGDMRLMMALEKEGLGNRDMNKWNDLLDQKRKLEAELTRQKYEVVRGMGDDDSEDD